MWKRTRRGQETPSIGDRRGLKLQDIPSNGFKYSDKIYEFIFDMINSDMSEDPGMRYLTFEVNLQLNSQEFLTSSRPTIKSSLVLDQATSSTSTPASPLKEHYNP
jgi:hypothetical protein